MWMVLSLIYRHYCRTQLIEMRKVRLATAD